MSTSRNKKAAADKSHLIQILLPTRYNDGKPIPVEMIEAVKTELVDRFGGVTAFTRSPAKGVWTSGEGRDVREDVVIVEVMAKALSITWWRWFRKKLERDLNQKSIVIRAQTIKSL